jgi:hypothetical protein
MEGPTSFPSGKMSPIFSKADPKGWLEGNDQRNLLLKAALISA